MMTLVWIERLLHYAVAQSILDKRDISLARNKIWGWCGMTGDIPEDDSVNEEADVFFLLEGLIGSLPPEKQPTMIYEKDAMIAEIMSFLIPGNASFDDWFKKWFLCSPQLATTRMYEFAQKSGYIRTDRIKNNIKWTAPSQYGMLDLTINLSKPEKTPEEIAMMKTVASTGYPKCMLCKENVGYGGNPSYPAKHNLRTISIELGGEPWWFQYSPYVYYHEHAIAFCDEHRPMKIDAKTICRLFDFIDYFPHYFIGSNADLHTVGGSILNHDHYQAGRYEMPMMRAKYIYEEVQGGVTLRVLDWPLSVLSLQSERRDAIESLAAELIDVWSQYNDEEYDLRAWTGAERHNTITPIARKIGDHYELFVALRNNRANAQHPKGIFHPHAEHHHIKRENIGLIEVMGLAVLPGRLKEEFSQASRDIRGLFPITWSASVEKHAPWLDQFVTKEMMGWTTEKIENEIYRQVGIKYGLLLEDSGIFKGRKEGFLRLIQKLSRN